MVSNKTSDRAQTHSRPIVERLSDAGASKHPRRSEYYELPAIQDLLSALRWNFLEPLWKRDGRSWWGGFALPLRFFCSSTACSCSCPSVGCCPRTYQEWHVSRPRCCGEKERTNANTQNSRCRNNGSCILYNQSSRSWVSGGADRGAHYQCWH